MKPIIKQHICIFYPHGFVDGLNANIIIEPSDITFTISKKPKAVFISLKKVIFFNKKGLSVLIEAVKAIQDKTHCAIGFCEYDKKKYDTILSMFEGELDFSLFESIKVLSLFFEDEVDREQKILVYSEDIKQKNQLAIELYEVGHKPYVAKDQNDYLQKKDEYTKYGIVICMSYIVSVDNKINVFILNSMIFYNLSDFIDSSISKKFDLDYHENLLRVGFKVFVFDITNVLSINIHGVNFFAKLSTAGAEYGTTFCMIGVDDKKLRSQLRNDLEDSGIVLYETKEQFLADEDIQKEAISGGKSYRKNTKLDKNIISKINVFIDTSLHITQMLSQKKGKKQIVKVDKLQIPNDKKYMICLFGIYGSLDAMFTMVFSKKLLLKTCKIFINDETSEDELKDAFAEYANIISSKIKSNFKLYKIDIEVTLPRIFKDTAQALEFFGERKGVLIDLDFDDEDLKLFLSK